MDLYFFAWEDIMPYAKRLIINSCFEKCVCPSKKQMHPKPTPRPPLKRRNCGGLKAITIFNFTYFSFVSLLSQVFVMLSNKNMRTFLFEKSNMFLKDTEIKYNYHPVLRKARVTGYSQEGRFSGSWTLWSVPRYETFEFGAQIFLEEERKYSI